MTLQQAYLILGGDNWFPARGNELEQTLLYVEDESVLVPATVIEVDVERDRIKDASGVVAKKLWAPALRDTWKHVSNQIELRDGF
jgi:hypothetical protein